LPLPGDAGEQSLVGVMAEPKAWAGRPQLVQPSNTMVLRNSLYNLLGLGLPLIVAVVAIPALIDGLGVAQFGILAILWAIVSYFGLFDLGLGRVVTQQVTDAMSRGDAERLGGVLATSCVLMAALGVAGGIILAVSAPLLAQQFAPGNEQEVRGAFLWMAVAMPAIVLTSGFRGVLEAIGRFGLINVIRLPMGIFTYAGPLAVVWGWEGGLAAIAAVLSIGRILACAIHGVFALRSVRGTIGQRKVQRSLIGPLLAMGGWMTVSNVVSPLMNYVDRFVLGLAVSAQAVAYYATPQELVLRVGIVPTAVAAVLFPLFASHRGAAGEVGLGEQLRRYSLVVLLLLLPMCLALGIFAEPLLAAWISPAFAGEAALPLQIMSAAALASGLAQVPFAMLQGRARADLTAKIHLVEAPIYFAVLYVLVAQYGAIGAAWAWLLRITADMVVMFVFCHREIRSASCTANPIPASQP
jgi:O-antigen/teichoic acid export membrane protein